MLSEKLSQRQLHKVAAYNGHVFAVRQSFGKKRYESRVYLHGKHFFKKLRQLAGHGTEPRTYLKGAYALGRTFFSAPAAVAAGSGAAGYARRYIGIYEKVLTEALAGGKSVSVQKLFYNR